MGPTVSEIEMVFLWGRVFIGGQSDTGLQPNRLPPVLPKSVPAQSLSQIRCFLAPHSPSFATSPPCRRRGAADLLLNSFLVAVLRRLPPLLAHWTALEWGIHLDCGSFVFRWFSFSCSAQD